MAFRADEAAQTGLEWVRSYLISKEIVDSEQRERSKKILEDLVTELGPVVDRYPTWHPLVCNNNIHDVHYRPMFPSFECSYKGLDHTRGFANGFITCPYGNGQEVIDSINALPPHHVASITAEKLDVQFYHPKTSTILVKCKWNKGLLKDGTIPVSVAIPLILEREIPHWRFSTAAETWETMRPYFLGEPHGSRSSLFINQETGLAIKKIWNSLIYTGMFGPIYV